MDNKKILKAAEELVRPVVEGLGFELVDIRILAEMGRTVLRVMADRPGGIKLDECAAISREVGPHLEVADIFPYAYNLEVSSPGLRRPIKNEPDVDRFKDQKISLTTTRPINGRRRFKGVNLGMDGEGSITLETGGEIHHIRWADVEEAHLDPELPFGDKRVGKAPVKPKPGQTKRK